MSRFRLLSDAQWELIEDLLPVRTGKKGRPFRDARQMAVDSTIARAHQHATNVTRHTGGWVELQQSPRRAA
jgi:hypothetical protein